MNSSSLIMPRRIFSEEISDCSDRMRVASCSADISSEKKPTMAPSRTLSLPSIWRSALIGLRHLEGDIGRQRRLPHRRTAGKDDEVGRLQPAHFAVEIAQARGNARQPAVALIGVVRHLDGMRQRGVEGQEALAVLARLGKREEAAFGFLDLLFRREIDRRIVGRVDHVLADA